MTRIEAYLVGELEGVRLYADGYAEVDVRLSDGTVETVLLTPTGYEEFMRRHGLEESSFDSSDLVSPDLVSPDFVNEDTVPEVALASRANKLKN